MAINNKQKANKEANKKKLTLSQKAFDTGQFGSDRAAFNIVKNPNDPKSSTNQYQIGNQKVTKNEYEVIKGQLGFDSKGGMITPRTEEVLAGIKGTKQNQAIKDQQTQDLATQQQQELAATGQQDFTQLGQEQQPTGEIPTALPGSTAPQFQNRLVNNLFGNQMQLDAQAAGGELQTGALPLGSPAILQAITPQATFAATSQKVTKAVSSLKNIKVLGLLGAGGSYAYGLLTKGKVNDIEGDINDMVALSSDLARQVNNGADPLVVREQLIDMENEIKDKIAELNAAKRISLADRIIGADSQTYARKQVTKILLRRQAVERYMQTGDINAYNAMIGTYGLQE